jgi:DnaJ-class molecular chaperone
MDEDYYKILGISRNASDADIQKAYRSLARQYHPDVNPDDDSAKKKFQSIQKAYDVLKDPEKRELYDRYGSSFESMGGGGPGPGQGTWRSYGPGPEGFEEFDFSQVFGNRFDEAGGGYEGGFGDIFRQFAGASQPRRGRRRGGRGGDLRHQLQVPLNSAVLGGEAQLTVRRPTGKVENIAVKIPAGIEDGKVIRLRGQGQPGPAGGQPGDLLITVQVAPHPHFKRRGRDLEVVVPITLGEAALGAKIDVPSPRGTISVKVPPSTSSGRRLRIKGQGVGSQDKEPGDLYAILQIVLPEKLDSSAEDLVRQFEKGHPMNPRAGLQW